ncbi:MAG TPA: tRNA pseudouridine(38-40) synthase TruA [Thermodesulfovibrionales bacterium]|nr:tRNA pseudouridine(38-40) synthase TruA [Thermodesulfovibrionales bacterium]
MRYIKLLLEYDGTAYQGWQSQRSGLTIQDILGNAIAGITGSRVRLTAASRTDAGVHALGQVAAFGTGSDLAAGVMKRALNAKLPRDIRILSAEETHQAFHPRYDAKKKRYVYIVMLSSSGSSFFPRYTWQVRSTLASDAMSKAAAHLFGKHDFSAFRGSGCGARTTIRTISSIALTVLDRMDFMSMTVQGVYIKVAIEADAFLRHMVRNIVGTLVEVGKGRISVDEIPDILESRDRTKAGPTAPSSGLFLERVYY